MHAENRLANVGKCCPRCDLPAVDRLNYFTGQFLAERDFRTEQEYHVGKHRNHNRYLHGWGTVCGLKVIPHPNEKCPDRVVIRPGLAVDCCGREIVVDQDVCVDLARYITPEELAKSGIDLPTGDNLRLSAVVVSVCYRECAGEQAPVLYSECGCGDDGGLRASRIHETFAVKVEPVDLANPPDWMKTLHPAGVKLAWSSTMNLDRATRAAVSPDGARLYVITDAEKGVLHAYATANGCLDAARPIVTADGDAMRALDVAASPDGTTVYVLCRPAGATANVEHVVLTFAASDLAADPAKIALGKASPTDRDALACDAAGALYIVLPGGANKERFYLVKPAATTATAVDTGSAKLASMAVAPGGRFVFLAVDAQPQILVFDRAAGSVAPAPIDAPANVLAVTEDEKTLVTAGPAAPAELRAYALDAAGKPATPAKVAAADPAVAVAALTAAHGWAYVATDGAGGGDHGTIRAIELAKFGSAALPPDAEPIVADPRQVIVAPDGSTVYVVGHGRKDQTCGGVSVLKGSGTDCEQILWRQLDGCPPCEIECVPLALIVGWKMGGVIKPEQIRNELRPLLPSTNTLRDLILCCCGHHEAPAPPTPVPEPDPPAGSLARIVRLSWKHNLGEQELAEIKGVGSDPGGFGFVIEFDQPVHVDAMAPAPGALKLDTRPDRIFEICVLSTRLGGPANGGASPGVLLDPPVPIRGRIRLVDQIVLNGDLIVKAAVTTAASATGLAFVIGKGVEGARETLNALRQLVASPPEFRVCVKGDFISDEQGRAVDVDFTRSTLATGNRPRMSEGGRFESWFALKKE